MTAARALKLDDCTLWFIEKGPIREMVEIAFESALYRLEREQGRSLPQEAVRESHDRVVKRLFYRIMASSQHLRRQGEQYVVSAAGQAEMHQEARRMLAAAFWEEAPSAAEPVSGGIDVLWRPPLILRCLAKFFSPRTPSS